MARPAKRGAGIGADGTTRVGLRRLYTAVVITGLSEGVFWIALVSLLEPALQFEFLLAAAVVARLAPRALLSYAAGRLLDRSDVRRLLVGSEALRGLIFLGLGAAVAAGAPTWLVLVTILVSYTVGAPTRPAVMAILPRLAGETQLASAAATLSTIRQLVTFAGPLLGVAVVQVSVPAGFLVKGAAFVLSAVLLGSVRNIRWPGRAEASTLPESTGRASSRQPLEPGVVGLIVLVGGMYVVRGAEMVLYVLVVTDLLGAPAASLGFLSGGAGFGALLAAPFATRVITRLRPAGTLTGAVLLTAAPTLLLTVVGSVLLASAATAVVGAGMVLFEVAFVLTLQRVTADGRLGTVFGAVDSASNAGMLLGALLVPVLVRVAGVDGALAVVAAGIVLALLATAPALLRVSRAAADRLEVIEPAVKTLERVALFSEASRAGIERLAGAAVVETVGRGVDVIRQGEPADDLWVVRSGDLEVLVDGRRVNVVGTEGWFGEIGLVDRVPRTASVRSLTPVTLLRIPGAVFLEVLVDGAAPPSVLLDGIATRSARGRGR